MDNEKIYKELSGEESASARVGVPNLQVHRRRLEAAARLAGAMPRHRVLDIGCGNGELRKYLPSGCYYVGYDPVDHLVQEASLNENPTNTELHVGDAYTALERGERADIVFMLGVVATLEQDEVRDVLRAVNGLVDRPGAIVVSIQGSGYKGAFRKSSVAEISAALQCNVSRFTLTDTEITGIWGIV